jgi:hypothetical protein
MSRRKRVLNFLWSGAIGAVAAVVAAVLSSRFDGIASHVVFVVVCVGLLAAARWAIRRYWLPPRLRAHLLACVTPDCGPPPEALPVAGDVARKWAHAVTQRDWRSARGLVDDDLAVYTSAARPRARREFFRGLHILTAAFAGLRLSIEDVRAAPAQPNVLWVCLSLAGRSRRGLSLQTTAWERWTLDQSMQRIKTITAIGTTSVR